MTPRITTLLAMKPENQEVLLKGWIRTRRDSKNLSFLEINDGSCLGSIQVLIDKDTFPDIEGLSDLLTKLTTGASVEIQGLLKASPGSGQSSEVHALTVNLLGEAPPD
ncbi:MAG: asparagine--tRNA ligase, partial [Spirochaetales bacterium]